MCGVMSPGLFDDGEPKAAVTYNAKGRSPFLLTCDHASNLLPRRLGNLGLTPAELASHIAWDLGAAAVARMMATRLDARAVVQSYSRLVVDCNRPPAADSSIVELSENTEIPGNRSIAKSERETRLTEVFWPYHDRIRAELDARHRTGMPTVLVALHSFTPVFKGVTRPWHVGVLYNRDSRLAKPFMELLKQDGGLVVGDNQPYSLDDATDYTIPVHAEQRGLPHVEIEIRQDLIADHADQEIWAQRLAEALESRWTRIAV